MDQKRTRGPPSPEFANFEKLVKQVVRVPKAEIDGRAAEERARQGKPPK